MTPEELKKHQISELTTLREHMSRNDGARDSTLIQLSVALLAVFATFGKDLLLLNITLSILVIISLSITIFVTVIGFVTTEKLYDDVKQKIINNDPNTKQFWASVNTLFNSVSIVSFLLGMTFFISILITFTLGVK